MGARKGPRLHHLGHLWVVHPSPEIANTICGKPVDLSTELCADEHGHETVRDGLRSPNNGHGPTEQKAADKIAIDLQAAVVMDEAVLLERIHKFTYP